MSLRIKLSVVERILRDTKILIWTQKKTFEILFLILNWMVSFVLKSHVSLINVTEAEKNYILFCRFKCVNIFISDT